MTARETGPAAMPQRYKQIDHIALAVRELESAIALFRDVLGFELMARRTVRGSSSGMVSAEMEYNGIKFVLCQGTEPASQVTRLIDNYGPGIAHIALAVDDVEGTEQELRAQGLSFDTSIIRGPGLKQLFSSRDANSGLSFEFIERNGEAGFVEGNVQELFQQLEKSGSY